MEYKPVTYTGFKIEFVKEDRDVCARIPAVTNQVIGRGRTKPIAKMDAMATINRVYLSEDA